MEIDMSDIAAIEAAASAFTNAIKTAVADIEAELSKVTSAHVAGDTATVTAAVAAVQSVGATLLSSATNATAMATRRAVATDRREWINGVSPAQQDVLAAVTVAAVDPAPKGKKTLAAA
jgi:hypothetical protein